MKPGPRKFELTADVLLRAYSIGVFPMAESRESAELFWVEPQERGVFPLDGLVVSRSLAKTVRSERESTWINEEILRLYCDLHDAGYAHSVEVYENGALVGGLYGVSLRSAFFGESMFHRARDASKAALVHLVARLRAGGYRLLDTQFLTEHLASLGAIAVTREDFRHMLAESLRTSADFCAIPAARALPGGEALALALGTEVAKQTRDDGDRRVRT
jgi:leucyl/phenylalanyl-tRNA--protein transferase